MCGAVKVMQSTAWHMDSNMTRLRCTSRAATQHHHKRNMNRRANVNLSISILGKEATASKSSCKTAVTNTVSRAIGFG